MRCDVPLCHYEAVTTVRYRLHNGEEAKLELCESHDDVRSWLPGEVRSDDDDRAPRLPD